MLWKHSCLEVHLVVKPSYSSLVVRVSTYLPTHWKGVEQTPWSSKDTAARFWTKTSMSSTARGGAQVLLVARDVVFHFALLSRSDVAGTLCHKEGKSLLKIEDKFDLKYTYCQIRIVCSQSLFDWFIITDRISKLTMATSWHVTCRITTCHLSNICDISTSCIVVFCITACRHAHMVTCCLAHSNMSWCKHGYMLYGALEHVAM